LPPPRKEGYKPLLQALSERRSTREYSARPLSDQVLSDLLWAALGINRPQSGDRTAPSWRHAIELIIYARACGDTIRKRTASWRRCTRMFGTRPEARTSLPPPRSIWSTPPTVLVWTTSPEDKRLYAYTDTGFIGQNVYLFCASEGLATIFRGLLDRAKLHQVLQLPASPFVAFAQTVVYPRNSAR
jgi:nitroreductase